MPRPKKTDTEIQAIREQILDTAYAILQASGPEALTSRAIAERMGMAHMSLFTYFKNQAAILVALREREMSKMARPGGPDRTALPKPKISPGWCRSCWSFILTLPRENPNLYRLAWVMPEVGFESPEENRQRMQATVGHLAALLKLGMERGTFESARPFLAAGTVLGMVNMPHILFHSGKLVDPVHARPHGKEVLSAAMTYLKKL